MFLEGSTKVENKPKDPEIVIDYMPVGNNADDFRRLYDGEYPKRNLKSILTALTAKPNSVVEGKAFYGNSEASRSQVQLDASFEQFGAALAKVGEELGLYVTVTFRINDPFNKRILTSEGQGNGMPIHVVITTDNDIYKGGAHIGYRIKATIS